MGVLPCRPRRWFRLLADFPFPTLPTTKEATRLHWPLPFPLGWDPLLLVPPPPPSSSPLPPPSFGREVSPCPAVSDLSPVFFFLFRFRLLLLAPEPLPEGAAWKQKRVKKKKTASHPSWRAPTRRDNDDAGRWRTAFVPFHLKISLPENTTARRWNRESEGPQTPPSHSTRRFDGEEAARDWHYDYSWACYTHYCFASSPLPPLHVLLRHSTPLASPSSPPSVLLRRRRRRGKGGEEEEEEEEGGRRGRGRGRGTVVEEVEVEEPDAGR